MAAALRGLLVNFPGCPRLVVPQAGIENWSPCA